MTAQVSPIVALREYGVQWQPPAGDALHLCAFARAGFRAYSLTAPDESWRIVVSRVDVAEREPRGLLTVYAPDHEAAFRDLDGQVLSRTVSLFGGTNMRQVVDTLARRLGGSADDWTRRLDYLTARALRELQAQSAGRTFVGPITRPNGGAYVFDGRVRMGRTLSLFGPGSSGKTTLADALVVSLATGLEVVPDWHPTRRYVCGVVDWDEGQEETQARVFAILHGIGLDVLPTPYHYLPMTRPLADAADEVGRWATENGIEVLIVSPVNRALRPANGDPGGPVFELYEVLRELGTTNLLVDHVAGANIENRETAREYGSVAKRDSARGSYSVFLQAEEPGERVVVLRNTKPDALAPRRAPQAVRITFDPPWPDGDGVYDAIRFSTAEVEAGSILTGPKESQIDRLARLVSQHGPIGATELATLGGFRADRLHDLAYKARLAGHPVQGDRRTGIYRMASEEE